MQTTYEVLKTDRTIGFYGATGIGVGAMVGGGILALAGVAFAATGPSALLAFVLNGVIAFITALSFAEMAAANPQSGGTYTFAKKALTVQVAFGVGWVVWFASLMAAVLYALGFGAFALFALEQAFEGLPSFTALILALGALGFYIFKLTRSSGSGGMFANITKLLVFTILIAGGLAAFFKTPFSHVTTSLQPFFSSGFSGLLAAMGYTFIALQGFDLIASASGEIKKPERTIPRAMIATLVVGLAIYIPLLFVVSTVGMEPGQSIQATSEANPETVIAIAAQNYLGAFGFWLVIVAGIFSMLSALQANLFAASRIGLAMAKDRTLTHHLSYVDPVRKTPTTSILVVGGIVGILIIALPNVAAAGAASSLIFLITFALAHVIMILMRKRTVGVGKTFRVPLFPYLPIFGMAACLGLAIFQAIAVPAAGIITLIWLLAGSVLFVVFFLSKARVYDASAEAIDPNLVRLRGLNPLVLVPIANPQNAKSMAFVANALAPPQVGRVLLLSILNPDDVKTNITEKLANVQQALEQALTGSFETNLKPDSLLTIAEQPWDEIERVVRVHNCRSLLLGLSSFSDIRTTLNLEKLVSMVTCDLVVFRQPYTGWQILKAKKIMVPVAGYSAHDALRARVVGSIWRESKPEITFVQIIPNSSTEAYEQQQYVKLHRFANGIVPQSGIAEIVRSDDITGTLVKQTKQYDLVIMGLQQTGKHQRAFSNLSLKMAKETDTALIFIRHSQKL